MVELEPLRPPDPPLPDGDAPGQQAVRLPRPGRALRARHDRAVLLAYKRGYRDGQNNVWSELWVLLEQRGYIKDV